MQYGRFSPNDSQKIIQPEFTQMSSTFPLPSNFLLKQSFSKQKISADFANLLLERYFFSSEKIKLGFLSGLSGVWIKRIWNMQFYDDNSSIVRHIRPTWHYKGVGIKTGIDFDWILKHGFSWVGKSCIACMFGNYDIWMKVKDMPSESIYENSHLDDFRVVTNLQMLLGPSWEKKICRLIFTIKAYYEINVWLNVSQTNRTLFQNSTSNPQSRFTNNTLQMHGLILYASFNF